MMFEVSQKKSKMIPEIIKTMRGKKVKLNFLKHATLNFENENYEGETLCI